MEEPSDQDLIDLNNSLSYLCTYIKILIGFCQISSVMEVLIKLKQPLNRNTAVRILDVLQKRQKLVSFFVYGMDLLTLLFAILSVIGQIMVQHQEGKERLEDVTLQFYAISSSVLYLIVAICLLVALRVLVKATSSSEMAVNRISSDSVLVRQDQFIKTEHSKYRWVFLSFTISYFLDAIYLCILFTDALNLVPPKFTLQAIQLPWLPLVDLTSIGVVLLFHSQLSVRMRRRSIGSITLSRYNTSHSSTSTSDYFHGGSNSTLDGFYGLKQ